MAEKQEPVNFNAHLSSIVKDDLVNRSKIATGNTAGWFFNIVFPDIPELNGTELVVPLSNKEWPHYVYDEIFSCINAKYPEITSPSFQCQSYRLQIYIEGQDVEVVDQETKSTYLPNGATVDLRYHRGLIGPVLGREEVGAAGAAGAGLAAPVPLLRGFHGDDDWRNEDWDENWDWEPAAPALAAPALAAPAADAMAAHADAAAAAPADPFPPILHPASRTMMTYDHKQHRYIEPILNGVSGKWMIYDPANEWYSEPLAPWSGGPPTPGTAMQGPPPTIYPNTGEQTGPYKYGGKRPQSKRGKKKQKSKSKSKKSKTKKSKSKSKRNKRRSYKRVN
jgi:hypothetical protein